MKISYCRDKSNKRNTNEGTGSSHLLIETAVIQNVSHTISALNYHPIMRTQLLLNRSFGAIGDGG